MDKVNIAKSDDFARVLTALFGAELIGSRIGSARLILDGELRVEFGAISSRTVAFRDKTHEFPRGDWTLSFLFGNWKIVEGALVVDDNYANSDGMLSIVERLHGKIVSEFIINGDGEISLSFNERMRIICTPSEDPTTEYDGEDWSLSRGEHWHCSYFSGQHSFMFDIPRSTSHKEP
jgi:hypothetical protein